MKRFSKILAFVLALMMLVGMLAVFASAANVSATHDSRGQLDLTNEAAGIKGGYYHTSSTTRYASSDFNSGSNGNFFATSNIPTPGKLSFRTAPDGNRYVSVWQDGSINYTATKASFDFTYFNRAQYAFFENDYIVYDYEIGTDKYILTLEHIFGEDLANLEKNADGYAAYIADNTAGIEAGTLYTDANGDPVKYEQQQVHYTDVVVDEEGYASYVEGNTAGVEAGTYITDAQGNKLKLDDLKLGYLAYSHSIMFYIHQAAKSSYLTVNPTTKYNATTNQWSFGYDGVFAPLSREAGVWNHITIVFAFNNTIDYINELGEVTTGDFNAEAIEAIRAGESYNGYVDFNLNIGSSRMYLYLDGEYITSIKPFVDAYNTTAKDKMFARNADLYVTRMQLFDSGAAEYYANNKFSMCFDNMAVNYYKDGYAGQLADHVKNDPTQPIYNLDDVVYKSTYITDNDPVAFVYANPTDTEPVKSFDIAKAAMDYAAVNGGYVVLNSNLNNYNVPENATQNVIYVKTAEGVEFTLAEDCPLYVTTNVTEDGFTQLATTAKLAFYLTDESFAAGTPDEVVYIGIGEAMQFSGEVVDGKLYLGEGKHQVYSAWNYYATLDGEAVAFEYGAALSEELYAAVIAAGGTLHVHPEYEYKQAYFGFTDSTGVETFYYTAAELFSVDSLLTTSYSTVTFYTDILYDANESSSRLIDFGLANTSAACNNLKLRFDLNGKELIIYNAVGNTRLFGLWYGMSLNVYSSKPGGHISLQAGRIFDSRGKAACSGKSNITFGAYGDIPGDNLTVYADRFMYSAPHSSSTLNNLTIDGGKYFFTNGFMSLRDSWNVNINNAVVTTNGNHSSSIYAMFQTHASYDTMVHVTATHSTLIARNSNKADYLMHIENANRGNSSITCSDTVIAGAHLVSAASAGLVDYNFGRNTEIWTDSWDLCVPENFDLTSSALVKCTGSLTASETCDYYSNTGATTQSTVSYTGKYCFRTVDKTELPDDIKINIATNNGFWINYYIPIASGLTVSGSDLVDNVVIGDVEYAIYAVKGIAPNSVEDATLDIVFAYEGANYTWTSSVSLYDYFKAVMDGEYSELSKDLVMNAVNYCNAVYKATNEDADYAPYAELLAVEENAARVDTVVVEDVVENIDNTVITSATLMITDGNTAKFAFGNGGTGANLIATITRIDGTTKQFFAEERGEYYVIDEMSAYDMAATIVLTNQETGELVAEYNIAAYLANTADATVTAFYGYVKAAIAYQMPNIEQN